MTIQQLEYILEIHRTGSITQAAKNLYATQSGISWAVSALEDELGFRIFSRSWQGAVPTRRGMEVLAHAAQICAHHRAMVEGEAGSVRTVRIATTLYQPLCAAFARLAQEQCGRRDVALSHLTSQGSGAVLEGLKLFEIDAAVILALETFKSQLQEPELDWQIRRNIPVVLRIGPGHRLYHEPELTARDFRNERIIDAPDAVMMKAGALWPFLEIDRTQALLESDRVTRYEMVAAGLGYALSCKLPDCVDRRYGFRNITLEGPHYQIISVTNRKRPPEAEVRRYLELVDEELAGV